MVDLCYNGVPAPNTQLPMAITMASDGLDNTRWKAALEDWKNKGGQGSPPDMAPFIVPRPTLPNTMDLCTWYLKALGGDSFVSIDDATIAKVQEQSFLDGLQNNDKAIDALVQSLAGTFGHEVSHSFALALIKRTQVLTRMSYSS